MALAQKEAAKANAQDDIFEKMRQLGVKSGDLILIKLQGDKAVDLQSGKVCGDYILAVVNWIHPKDMRVQTVPHV